MGEVSSTDQSLEDQYAEYLSDKLRAAFNYRDWHGQQFGCELDENVIIAPRPITEAVMRILEEKLN